LPNVFRQAVLTGEIALTTKAPVLRGARIAGTGSAVPDRILTNFDLEKMVDTSDEWIVERTGIRERRIASEDVVTSDLASQAALRALDDAGMTAEEVDLIIVATVTPDTIFPSCACWVQAKIGAKKAAAFDISAGCTGFVYAVSLAWGLVAQGAYDSILVVGAETLSRIVDWEDRNTCVLFGDGAGAAVVKPCELGEGILEYVLKSDGTGSDVLIIPAGGSGMPASHETVESRLHYIKMKGNPVYRFAVRAMVEATSEVEVAVGPRVAVISTGDELTGILEDPVPGQIRDGNAYALYSSVKALGGRPKLWGIVRDEYEVMREVFAKAHAESDMVIVSGGSSIGERDFTRQAIQSLGEPGILVHGAAIKPGKPTILAVAEGKPVFGLPGHPMSCLVVFNLFCAPAIARWMGATVDRLEISARLGANVPSIAGREDFVSVKLREQDGEVWAEPIFSKSAVISGLVYADGIMRIPLEAEGVEFGEKITVKLF
jgi:3-oxoacyl-[acyl-carrier-protein] synthase-3